MMVKKMMRMGKMVMMGRTTSPDEDVFQTIPFPVFCPRIIPQPLGARCFVFV